MVEKEGSLGHVLPCCVYRLLPPPERRNRFRRGRKSTKRKFYREQHHLRIVGETESLHTDRGRRGTKEDVFHRNLRWCEAFSGKIEKNIKSFFKKGHGSLSPRQLCAVESLLRTNPDLKANLLFLSTEAGAPEKRPLCQMMKGYKSDLPPAEAIT